MIHLVAKIGLVALLEPRQPRQEDALYALQSAQNQGHVHVAVGIVAGSAEQGHRGHVASFLDRAHVIESRRAESTLVHASEQAVVAGQVVQHRGQVAGPGGDQLPLHIGGQIVCRQGSVCIQRPRFDPKLTESYLGTRAPCPRKSNASSLAYSLATPHFVFCSA